MDKKLENQEAIVAEYLSGDVTLRQLGLKHDLDFRKTHYWISCYKGKIKPKAKVSKKELKAKVESLSLPIEVTQLQAELLKAKLHSEVLKEMLKLSEHLTGIELRKKFGTRQF